MYPLYIGNSPPYIIYIQVECPGFLLLVTETNTSSCNCSCRFILVDTSVQFQVQECS